MSKHVIRVKFRNESGVDGGGLTRELFPLFWSSLQYTHFDGNVEKIPVSVPRSADEYETFGRILSHGFVLTGFSPQCSLQAINIHFCVPPSEFERRPTASTCSMTLCLPTTYQSFSVFVREFTEVLENSHMWSFDAL